MSTKRRGRPDFDALTEAQLIAGRTAARSICLPTVAPQSLGELMDVIDHVTEVATGDRSFLHLKPHSSAITPNQTERQSRLRLISSQPVLPARSVNEPS